ncbi:MAG: undecaprenyldiphospho-muramoylpentapeptide beta-N-acetylglucosaminyltransferase [Firmicutes bacterium HGW-Firmicutes-19]|nr:MAG: undecaprenyldiphospho-muramoylpentapeptide beta-N-acetylglucosaminyltransferase [Firmicutes bacterium HGW-Firmicutes-19]
MKVCMTAGGTGGHIFPAIALADACKAASMDVFFIGNKDKMEALEVPKAGYPFFQIENKGYRGNLINKVNILLGQFKAIHSAAKIIQKQRPDIVVAFGGYVTVPVVIAAKLYKINVLIHEQNAVAGKANIFLSRFVDGIAVSYPQSLTQFKHHDVRLIGNPRATVAHLTVSQGELIESMGLDANKKTALIVMGSQGSESVNEVLKKFVLNASSSPHQFIIATGRKHYLEFIENLNVPNNVIVTDFVDQIKLLSKIDLLIARGGATSAAEMLAKGVASIIIPSPFVPNNHQLHNARALSEKGASVCIEEKDLTDLLLLETANEILNNDQLRLTMSTAAKTLGLPDALDKMVDWVKEIV